MRPTDTDGRVVMVSGANRGIGAAIAGQLAADGHRLSLGARRLDALAASAPDVDPDRILLSYHQATRTQDAGIPSVSVYDSTRSRQPKA